MHGANPFEDDGHLLPYNECVELKIDNVYNRYEQTYKGEEKMKKLIMLLVIISLIVPAGFACAGEETSSNSALTANSGFVPPCKQGNRNMMMECPMMKQQKDIKALLKNILELQQRSLTASSKDKVKIREEIANLIKKLDAMPDKMECPMMGMKRDDSSGTKNLPEQQTKEETKPSEHKH